MLCSGEKTKLKNPSPPRLLKLEYAVRLKLLENKFINNE